jgi:hypothetical protein
MKITRTHSNSYEVTCPGSDPVFAFGKFVEVREKHGMMKEYFRRCFVCGHSFASDEGIYFAIITGKGNRFVCKECNQKVREDVAGTETSHD